MENLQQAIAMGITRRVLQEARRSKGAMDKVGDAVKSGAAEVGKGAARTAGALGTLGGTALLLRKYRKPIGKMLRKLK